MSQKPSFVLSTEDVNSYGIRVLSAGIRTQDFATNPIMLYMHQRGAVIGAWENLRVEEGKLIADAEFDIEDDLGKKVAGQVKRKFLRATSVGIYILKYRFEKESGEEIMVVEECELIEVSIVDVPANKAALRLYDASRNEIDLSKGLAQFKLPDTTVPTKQNNEMSLKALAKVFGLPETATDDEITLAAQNAQKATSDLQKKQEEEQKERKARAVKLFDTAVAEKRVEEGKRDTFLKLAETDFVLFEETLTAIPKPVVPSLKDVATGKTEALGDAMALTEDRQKWTFEDWRKKDPDGLIGLQTKDWDKFKALYKAEYKEEPLKD